MPVRPKHRAIRLASLGLILAALSLYAATTTPSLTLAHGGTDGAELAVAVHTLGIPHPSGYPSYVLLAQGVRLLPWGDLAGRLNLFSAVAAALTVGLIALIAGERAADGSSPWPALCASLTAGTTLLGAGLFWSQAIITEVYSLHSLFLALCFWLLLRWRQQNGRGAALPLLGLALGLGLGNHLSLLFFLPGGLLFWLLAQPTNTGRRWRPALLALGLLALGLCVYLYLPLRAAADPWLNWGNPAHGAAFWEHVSGRAYQGLLWRVTWNQLLQRLSATAQLLLQDLGPWGLALGLTGLLLQAQEDRPTLPLLALPAVLGLALALSYGGVDSQVHLLPLYLAAALWAGLAAGWLYEVLHVQLGSRGRWLTLLLPLLALSAIPRGWSSYNLRSRPIPPPQQAQLLQSLPASATLLTDSDAATFPLWYTQTVQGVRPDVAIVDLRLLRWPWYEQQLPKRYPDLSLEPGTAAQDGLPALLQQNPGRPTFALMPPALPPPYRWRKEQGLYRLSEKQLP
ncbi:MAG: DUF2723 domain-containing protein [Chloroflexia bacterium]|nr:DUF2723 domain-containing protein [Chloroflexia bacterium]